jgi:putative ABC transport system permease protein
VSGSGPSRLGRLLLRLQPLGARRAEVEADLLELFALRARHHGEAYARRRFYGDVFSLWRLGRSARNAKNAKNAESFGFEVMTGVLRDLGYAARLLRRSPASVSITIVGLGLAIGVNTSVFSLINTAVLQSGGIDDPASAVRVMRGYENGMGTSWRYSDYVQLRDLAEGIRLEASVPQRESLALAGSTETVSVQFVTGGYLGVLSERPALGRLLTPADDRPGAPPVAVASHGYWSRRLGEDSSVIGRTLRFNGVLLTVVGVAPRNFSGSSDSPPSFWMPIASYHQLVGGSPIDASAPTGVGIVGRLKPSNTRQVAEARLSAVTVGLPIGADQSETRLTGVRLIPASGAMNAAETFRVALIIAVIATLLGLILLLACVNVANLMLASGISRQREIAVRLALGASRGRLARQLITESVSLGLLGGAVGFALSQWLVPVLATLTQFPVNLELAPDLRVYAFLTTMSVIAGVGAGLVPARHAVRHSLAAPLKGSAGVTATGGRPGRLRSVLISAQAAASIVLLILAALSSRGMVRATAIDVGFDASRLLVLSPAFPRGAYDRAGAKAYWDLAIEKIAALPGVRSTALASHPPFGNGNRVTVIKRDGVRYTIYHHETRADYFATIGLAIRRGRAYTEQEAASGAPVAVISETLARDYFGFDDPIGQTLNRIVEGSKEVIIGVAASAITARLRDLSDAAIYQPMTDLSGAQLVIRTDGTPDALVRSIRTALEPLDPRVRLEVRSVADGLARQLRESRIVAALAGVLAALALGLAVVGIYGVTSFVVGQRSQEISVRMALGASSRDVLGLLLSDSLKPVVLGLAVGVVLTILASGVFATRAFAGILYGGSSLDPLAFSGAAIVLLAAALGAVIVPARRAAGIEPAGVLRGL